MDAAPAVEIVWTQSQGGDECIGQNELRRRVQAALGSPAMAPSPEQPPAIVRGSIGPSVNGDGWLAAIEVRRGEAAPLRRELGSTAVNCRQLDEAIVLVVEMLLEATTPHTAPLVIENPTPSIGVSIGPDVAVGAGMLPGIYVGFGIVSEAEVVPRWPVAFWAHGWLPTRATNGTSGGQFAAFTFGAALCPNLAIWGRWTLFGCLGGSGGEVTSTGIALDRARPSGGRLYMQIDARVAIGLRIVGPLVARLALGGGAPVVRDTYAYVQADGSLRDVFRTAALTATGEFGVELRAP